MSGERTMQDKAAPESSIPMPPPVLEEEPVFDEFSVLFPLLTIYTVAYMGIGTDQKIRQNDQWGGGGEIGSIRDHSQTSALCHGECRSNQADRGKKKHVLRAKWLMTHK